MTEAEWLACADPAVMLERVADERKLRLFACACCEAAWGLVTEERCRDACAAALRYADGELTAEELQSAHAAAQNAKPLFEDANWAAAWTAAPLALRAADEASRRMARALAVPEAEAARRNAWGAVRAGARESERADAWEQFEAATEKAVARVRREQAELLGEIVGNPLRPVSVDPAWLSWNGGTVVALARSIYEEDRFEDMPILADALEEAGCTNAEMLDHCRQFEEHVRGCWVVDLVLGWG